MYTSFLVSCRPTYRWSKKNTVESGFGLVETIVSSVILATIIVTSMSLISQLQNSRYNSSLRDATRTLIDEDIELLKQHFFSVHYVSSTSSKCFQTNSECSSTFPSQLLNQRCTNYASFVSLSSIFSGNPFDIRRVITNHKPSISSGGFINSDNSIVRVTYILTSTTSRSVGLDSNSSGETLRVVDLYPDAHPYCNPE